MTPLTIIGENIKFFRVSKSIKQEILAKHLGITKGRMSQIEGGLCAELTLQRICKIAAYLEVDFFDILNKHSIHDTDTLPHNEKTNHNGFFVSSEHIRELAKHISIELKS
jgi:transcriptional regulator with XRE-family HTH domain